MRAVRRSVCVFCASSSGLAEPYRRAARDLGAELARRGHRLVYGGGGTGLMGDLARSVQRHGGTVSGVIPRSLLDRELAYRSADELVVTETLRERKAEMDARADAFVALPGGFGTLEELLEVITLRQLRTHDRPVVVVNVAGYYDPFLAMARGMVAKGFVPVDARSLFSVAATPAGALDLVEAGAPGADGEAPAEAVAEDWTAAPADPPPPGAGGTSVER